MSFNSLQFFIFFIVVYLAYRILGRTGQNLLLLIASYFFYGCWEWHFLSLLVFVTVVNFFGALLIERSQTPGGKRSALWAVVALDLGLLSAFKYFGFFAENIVSLLGNFGLHAHPLSIKLLLPVGISFYTFQAMSYPIDVYRGAMRPSRDLLGFAVFASFFPTVLAGPIERARRMLPQFAAARKVTIDMIYRGGWLIFLGFFMKVFVADNLVSPVGRALIHGKLQGGYAYVSMVLLTVQIYADFAGYSYMARGLALLMGFDVMQNFRTPFFSKEMGEVWQRWHISLTSWIKEYVYYPLGLSVIAGRHIPPFLVILVTWVIFGFWHGASWKFVAWGAYHGLVLIAGRLIRPFALAAAKAAPLLDRLSVPFRVLATFHLFALGIIFFGARDLAGALAYIRSFFTRFSTAGFDLFAGAAVFIVPLIVLEFFQWRSDDESVVLTWPWFIKGPLFFLMFYATVLYGNTIVKEYYYFRF